MRGLFKGFIIVTKLLNRRFKVPGPNPNKTKFPEIAILITCKNFLCGKMGLYSLLASKHFFVPIEPVKMAYLSKFQAGCSLQINQKVRTIGNGIIWKYKIACY